MTSLRTLLRTAAVALVAIAPLNARGQGDLPSARPRPVGRPAPARTTPLVADAVPRGLVTVVVPVPVELRDARDVSFEVRVSGEMEVLGRRAGQAIAPGTPARPLVLTMRVPAAADAGSIDAADVLFHAADGRELVVPIVVKVSVVRDVAISGPREMRGLRNGDRVELAYRVMNAGNAPDTVLIEVVGPDGWTIRLSRAARLVLAAHRPAEVVVHLGIPPTANVGDHPLTVSIRHTADEEATSSVFTALGITGRAGDVSGLVVRSTFAIAATSAGHTSYGSATLDGPVSANTFLRAHVNSEVRGDGMMMQGLGAVGAVGSPFSAALYGRRWDVTAGMTGLELSDLTGVSIAGEGVSARASTNTWDARAIGARPAVGMDADGDLYGAGFWRASDFGRFGASASRLSERGSFSGGRDLTAIGFDYAANPIGPFTLGGSVAHRESEFGSGLGYGFEVRHERDRDHARARYTHSPGGSAAFARAVDEWQAEIAHNLTERWAVDASATRSHDAGNVFSGMDVSSWSVGQRMLLKPSTTLSVRAQSSAFDAKAAASSVGDFGASDRGVTGAVDWQLGTLAINVEGTLGQVRRTTELSDGRLDRATAAQRSLDATVTRMSIRWGTLEGRAGFEQTESGVGIPASVWNASARVRSLPFSVRDQEFRLNAEANYQRLGSLQSALVTRATLQMALPGGFELAMAAERNPFFRDANGHAGWIGALRVTAATRVFSPRALGPEGVVYEDRNQNGRRDADEPGVPGVVVRRGESRATTSSRGAYRLPARARGRARIDQSSLPIGLLAHPSLAMDSVERLDLPVLPTGTVTVELELVPDQDGRVPQVDLNQAVVILRDAQGFEWVGRGSGKASALFDGVPVGNYDLRFDFSRLREPVRAQDTVKVTITPHSKQTIKAPLRGRVVRLFDSGRGTGRIGEGRPEEQQR